MNQKGQARRAGKQSAIRQPTDRRLGAGVRFRLLLHENAFKRAYESSV